MDKYPNKNRNNCKERFYEKISILRYKLFRCLLKKMGIVTPTIFR